ncbi:MAG: hypothetical protein MUF78_03730 [Candidatus Edwardsbacteria bacterium]|jgi:hypothetical protein|nr:hypothetical protein [Candidatus Edwardsbacteria bacterium]
MDWAGRKHQFIHSAVILASIVTLFITGRDPGNYPRTEPFEIAVCSLFSLYGCCGLLINKHLLRSSNGIDAFDSFSLSTLCYLSAILWVRLWGGETSHNPPSPTIIVATLMFGFVLFYGVLWMIKQRAMKSTILRVLGSLWIAGIMGLSLYLGMIGLGDTIFVVFG